MKETMKKTPEVILIGNEKGGVGKTATCLCLANALTALGYKVLVLDLDPSGHFSNAALPEFPDKVLYDVLTGGYPDDVVIHTDICDVLPTVKDIAPEEDSILPRPGMAQRKSLGDLFTSYKGHKNAHKVIRHLIKGGDFDYFFSQYDFILLDSQPTDSLIVTNAIVAADSIIIPCEPVSGAMVGLQQFHQSVKLATSAYGINAKFDGIVFTRYRENWGEHNEQVNNIYEMVTDAGLDVYKTRFRYTPSIERSVNNCKPILDPEYLYKGWGASDAINFTLEFLAKRGLKPRVEYKGIITDENGNLWYMRNGDKYYVTQQEGNTVTVETRYFRLEEMDEAVGAQVGKTVFFHTESLLNLFLKARSDGLTYIWNDAPRALADILNGNSNEQ